MKRKECLEKALAAVSGTDGEHDYGNGKPENNFKAIASFWRDYIHTAYGEIIPFKEIDVAIMMILLKTARAATSDKEDTYVDIAGYAACACEILNPNITF